MFLHVKRVQQSVKRIPLSVILLLNFASGKNNEDMRHICLTLAAAAVLTAVCSPLKANSRMENVLNEKQQCMAVIACMEAKGDINGLADAIGGGLDAGLTVSQIKEALSQLYAYTGFPRSLNALGTLQKVLAERRQRGIADDEGRDASPLPAGYDALRQGTEVQTKLSGKPFSYDFAPATDYYLKAHLFGDIFARDNLTHAERELVTVSALSGLEGVEPQLKSHVSGARNMGLSAAEIRSIPAVLAARVGDTEAWRAAKAIAEVWGEPFSEGRPVSRMMFPKGEPNAAYAKYFTGDSWLAPLSTGKVPVANVTFEPGCRNNWHVHHNGTQVLICVGGRGWYQEWGGQARELNPGDVVEVPEGVKHWHGAAQDSWFQHLAFTVGGEGASNEWLEPVTDEEYGRLEVVR